MWIRRWLEVCPVSDHNRVAALSKEEKLKKKNTERHGSMYCELLNMQPWGIQDAVCTSYEECGLWKKDWASPVLIFKHCSFSFNKV